MSAVPARYAHHRGAEQILEAFGIKGEVIHLELTKPLTASKWRLEYEGSVELERLQRAVAAINSLLRS